MSGFGGLINEYVGRTCHEQVGYFTNTPHPLILSFVEGRQVSHPVTFWTYILQCVDGSFYTGHTDDLETRVAQHQQGTIPGCHTANRRPVQLVYSQDFDSREAAFLAERQIKGWRREKKHALIAGRFDLLPALSRTAHPHPRALRQAQDERVPRPDQAFRQAQEERVLRPDQILLQAQDERVPRQAQYLQQAQDEQVLRQAPVLQQARDALVQERWMRHALDLAERAEAEDNEIPVGAVLVDNAGNLLAEGSNRNIIDHDPTAHAEIVAMRAAGRTLGNHRLVGCTLYVTLEPCAMCAMAVVHARIARVVYAASDPKTGAAGSVFGLLADPRHNHRVEVQGGLLADEAGARLTGYFRRKRGKPVG
jgi:tRNA(adenine34) deaminase